jgi:outer membrane cobalamin receptor
MQRIILWPFLFFELLVLNLCLGCRTLIGDTADSLAIRGFSGNRIMLNIDGRPVNASGVVGGYYIDWGTIPLDNIEKIEIIRGGSSVRYGNNALGGVVNVITKKPTETPTATLFGTYGGGQDIDSFQNYRLTHTYKIGALGYSLAGSYQKADPFLSSDINSAYPDGQLVLDRDVASDRSYGGSMEVTKPLGDHELLIGTEHKVLAYGDTTTNYVDLTYNNAAELLYRHGFGDSAYMRLSAYYYKVDDYIMMRFDPSWRGVYNIDRAELFGASIDGKTDLTDWLSGNLSLTWQHSKKEGDLFDTAGLSDEIDYLPDWKATAGLVFKLPYRGVFDVALRYVGERQTIYTYSSGYPTQQHFKLVELDPYVTADIDLKFSLGRHAEVSGYVENLFDEEYEEQFGYPMPGIVVGAALKLFL